MRSKSIVLVVGLLVISGPIFAQLIDWQRPLGGSKTDCAYDIKQTIDGGFITVGHTYSSDGDVSFNHGPSTDYWVVKLSSTGVLQWERTFGGSLEEHGYAVIQTNEKSYIIAGFGRSADGDITTPYENHDAWIISIDQNGNLLWQRNYGGSNIDAAYDICATADGGFVFAGSSNSQDGDLLRRDDTVNTDVWIVKIDGQGNVIWQHTYGGLSYEYANSVRESSNGDLIIAGVTASSDGDVSKNNGGTDMWVLKLDSQGELIWQRSLGGSLGDYANCAVPTIDGGIIIAASSNSFDGDLPVQYNSKPENFAIDGWLIKLNGAGEIEWSTMASEIPDYNEFEGVCLTDDSGYVVVGYCDDSAQDGECLVAKYSSEGELVWQQLLGGGLLDVAEAVCHTSDGGFAFTGSTYSSDRDVVILPSFHNPDTTSDFWVVKMTPECGVKIVEDWVRNGALPPFAVSVTGTQKDRTFDFDYTVRAEGNISMQLFNTLGKSVFTRTLAKKQPGHYHESINLETLSPGLYICHFSFNQFNTNVKLIIQ